MSDLAISGELQLSIDQSSKRAVEKEIGEISAPPVELQVDRGSDLGGAGGEIGNSVTSNLDQQLDSQLELDRERNDYLEEIADATGGGGGGLNAGRFRRVGDGGGGGGGGGLGAALALLAGGTALAGGAALTLADDVEVPYGGPNPVPVEDPGKVGYDGPKELGVEDPGEVGYGGPEEIGVEDPGKIGYDGPEELGVEDPGEVDTTVTVETTTGDTVGDGDPNQGDGGIGLPGIALGGLAAAGAAGLASAGSEFLSGLSAPKPGGAAGGTGIGFPAIGPMLAEPFVDDRLENSGGRGSVGGGRIAAAGAPLMMSTTPAFSMAGGDGQGGQETANRTGQRQSQAPEINFNPTYQLAADELERQMQQDMKDIRRRLDELERAITG